MKKIFLFSVLLLSTTAIWASVQIGGINYELNDSLLTAKVVTSEPTGDVIIPDSVKSAEKTYVVTEIGSEAFSSCFELTSVVLPNSLKKIGNLAFSDCIKLTSINLPDSVEEIGVYAFYSCGFTQPLYNKHIFASMPKAYVGAYTVPDGIETIARGAFFYCKSLTTVSLPSTLKTIMMHAFDNSGLQEIVIPEGVEQIDELAFCECSSLHKVSLPSTLEKMGDKVFDYCEALDTLISYMTTPTELDDDVFFGVNTGECTLYVPAESLAAYQAADGWNAFGNIQAIPAASGKYKIGDLYYNLNGDNKTARVTYDEEYIISGTNYDGLTTAIIPDSVQYEGNYYVVTAIGEYAFADCSSLQSIVISDSVKSIGLLAFLGCTSLQSIVIPDNVQTIGYYAFSGCSSLQSVTIGSGIQTITENAFSYCESLQAIVIPDNVQTIENNAFASCYYLESVTIGSGVQTIEDNAFTFCYDIKIIYNYAVTPQSIDADLFRDVQTDECTLYVPAASLADYQVADVWKEFFSIQTIESLATGIEGVQNTEYRVQKVIRDGKMLIIRDGAVYNACGQRVK